MADDLNPSDSTSATSGSERITLSSKDAYGCNFPSFVVLDKDARIFQKFLQNAVAHTAHNAACSMNSFVSCKTTHMTQKRPDFGASQRHEVLKAAKRATACEAARSVTHRRTDNLVKCPAVFNVSTMIRPGSRSTPLENSSASKSTTSWSTEGANHRALREATCFGVSLWVSEFQAQRSPLQEVLVCAGNNVAVRFDCDCALRSNPRSRNWKNSDQRNALCTSCAAHPPTITSLVKRKTSVGKPGDRPPWLSALAACTCRQMRSKADSAKRSNLYDSAAHPARLYCRPIFQSSVRTSATASAVLLCFTRTGS